MSVEKFIFPRDIAEIIAAKAAPTNCYIVEMISPNYKAQLSFHFSFENAIKSLLSFVYGWSVYRHHFNPTTNTWDYFQMTPEMEILDEPYERIQYIQLYIVEYDFERSYMDVDEEIILYFLKLHNSRFVLGRAHMTQFPYQALSHDPVLRHRLMIDYEDLDFKWTPTKEFTLFDVNALHANWVSL